jgi:hypothetical protein
LTSIEIEKLLTPITYQGSAQSFIERLIVSTQSRAPRRAESWASETKLPTAPQLRSADVATLRGEMPKFAPLAPPPEVMQILSPAASATPAAATSTAHRHTLDQLDAMAASSPDEHLRYQSAAEDPMPAPITEEETPSEDTGPETEPGVIAAEPEPTPPVDEDTPGAFMEILSRADAEATSDTEDKPKPS